MSIYQDNDKNLYYVWYSKGHANKVAIFKKKKGEKGTRWLSSLNKVFDTTLEAEIYLNWIAIRRNWSEYTKKMVV